MVRPASKTVFVLAKIVIPRNRKIERGLVKTGPRTPKLATIPQGLKLPGPERTWSGAGHEELCPVSRLRGIVDGGLGLLASTDQTIRDEFLAVIH